MDDKKRYTVHTVNNQVWIRVALKSGWRRYNALTKIVGSTGKFRKSGIVIVSVMHSVTRINHWHFEKYCPL